MDAARPDAPAKDTGLPPGVRVGSMGRRFVAYVIDSLIPAAAGVMFGIAGRGDGGGATVALVVVAALCTVAWALVCWQQLAVRAATPGMRAMKLQLVGFFDGRPVKWGRVFLRWLVLALLSATGIGLLLVVASVLISARHQGWHDRAAGAVVIAERPLAPKRTKVRTSRSTIPTSLPQPAGTADAEPTTTTDAPSSDPQPARSTQLVPTLAPVASPVAGDPALPPEPAEAEPVPATREQTPEQAPEPSPDLAPLASVAPVEAAPQPVAAATNGQHGIRRTILDGWVAELDDGREIAVRGLVLLGRNPQPEEGEDDAQLIKLADDSRTVSKTHLALGVDDAGLFVVDRGSTNGSTITPPGRDAVPAGAFHAVSVGEGSVVSIGDHWVRIRRDGS